MACKEVKAAVRARLAANWSACPVSVANVGGSVPADGSAFLSVEFPVAGEQLESVGSPGSNLFREEGALRLVLSVPAGSDLAAPVAPGQQSYDDWVETLRDLFRFQQFAGVTTWSAGPPTDDGSSENGAYYEISFAVPYRFDRFA